MLRLFFRNTDTLVANDNSKLIGAQGEIEVYGLTLVRIFTRIGNEVEDNIPEHLGVGLDQMLRSLTGDFDILPRLQRNFNPSFVQTAEGEEIIQNISQVVNR